MAHPWVNLSEAHYGTDRVLTSVSVKALYENAIAIAEGHPAAPKITNAALGDNIIDGRTLGANAVSHSTHMLPGFIHRLHLNTAVAQVSQSGGGTNNFVMPGGQWSFYPTTHSSATSGGGLQTESVSIVISATQGGAVGEAPRIGVTRSTSQGVMTVTQRYIPACPPYDLGDGEVGGFGYAGMEPDGSIGWLWLAADPPWLDFGRGDPTGDYLAGRLSRVALQELAAAEPDKLRGMPLCPQPCTATNAPRPVVLLDPMGEEVRELLDLIAASVRVGELFHCGSLRIDNDPLKRATPPGVPAHRVRWR